MFCKACVAGFCECAERRVRTRAWFGPRVLGLACWVAGFGVWGSELAGMKVRGFS